MTTKEAIDTELKIKRLEADGAETVTIKNGWLDRAEIALEMRLPEPPTHELPDRYACPMCESGLAWWREKDSGEVTGWAFCPCCGKAIAWEARND